MSTNNKNFDLIPVTTLRTLDLCLQLTGEFELPPGGAEMLILELLANSLVQADRGALCHYLTTLADQHEKGAAFDLKILNEARDRMAKAVDLDS